jgi:hypothetical protein
MLMPVGKAPVVVNLITSPAANPWLVSVITAGFAMLIVQVEPVGVAVINSPGWITVMSM